jgi:lysophospholipase L1-like esterase
MRARGAALALPAAAMGGLAMQAYRAAHAPLPAFADLDVSGDYGRGCGQPLRIAVLGDSTMTGPGLDAAGDVFVARAAHRLPQPVRLESHAVGGSRVRDVVEQQLPAVLASPPQVAVVSVGANDAIHGTPTRRFGRDLDRLLMALAAARVRTVACGVIDLSVLPRVPRALRPLVAARSASIDRVQARVVRAHALVIRAPAEPRVGPHFRDRGEALFAADRFHPNADGHAVIADACYPYLAEAVSRAVVDRAIDRLG